MSDTPRLFVYYRMALGHHFNLPIWVAATQEGQGVVISAPDHPVVVGAAPGHKAIWRQLKCGSPFNIAPADKLPDGHLREMRGLDDVPPEIVVAWMAAYHKGWLEGADKTAWQFHTGTGIFDHKSRIFRNAP